MTERPAETAAADASHLADQVIAQYLRAVEAGASPNPSDFVKAHPAIRGELESFFHSYQTIEQTVASAQAEDLTAEQEFGRYRLVREIGSGSFGTVWLGYDPQLHRPVAVKLPRHTRFSNREQRDAFLHEARTVARLEHPGIVPIYDIGQRESGEVYFVSRFIAGRDLATAMRVRDTDDIDAIELMIQVMEAIQFAHDNNVVHRDLKPSNLLLEATGGGVFVTDFGLASNPRSGHDLAQSESSIAGTPAYMSPEQASGLSIDGRSDLFSLGVVLFELLFDTRPFRGDNAAQLMRSIREGELLFPEDSMRHVPSSLRLVCEKALAKSPERRFQSARQFKAALLDCQIDFRRGAGTEEERFRAAAESTSGDADNGTVSNGIASTVSEQREKAEGPIATVSNVKGRTGNRWRVAFGILLGFGATLVTLSIVSGRLPLLTSTESAETSSDQVAVTKSQSERSAPSADRRITLKTIEIGGRVDFRFGQQNYEATEASQVPEGPIELEWVMFDEGGLIEDDFLNDLAALESLEGIDLLSCDFSDAGLASLASVRSLECVYVHNTAVTDRGVIPLAELPRLRQLNLSETSVSDACIAHFRGKQSLRLLDLSNTPISDEALSSIGTMKGLRDLDLNGCRVNDRGVRHLSRLTQLQQLEIDATDITEEALDALLDCPLRRLVIPRDLAIGAERKILKRYPNCIV
ncbi:MAG: protein kinase, partial [Planctomycetota bacterium]